MLLKSRSRTHHPNMHYLYTGGRRNNMPFHLDPPKNVLLLHWKKIAKIFLIGYPPNKCSKFLLISLSKFCCRKETWGYAKVIHKKELRKHGQVSKIFKTMGTQMSSWRKKGEMNKIAPVFLQGCFQVLKERYIFKEQSRIRLV